jgi:hypothetical protein
MTWLQYHEQSEQYACSADVARFNRDFDRAKEFYRKAAEQEELALFALDRNEKKGLEIISVSAAALWFKAGQYDHARELAIHWLGTNWLSEFAVNRLQELIAEVDRIEKLLEDVEEWRASLSVSSSNRDLLVKAVEQWKASASKATLSYQN